MCPSFNSADVSTSASAVHLAAVHHLKTLHLEAESSGWQNFVFTYEEVIPLPFMLFCLQHQLKFMFIMIFKKLRGRTFLPTEQQVVHIDPTFCLSMENYLEQTRTGYTVA